MRLLVTPRSGCELTKSWNGTQLPDEGPAWVFDLPDWARPAGLAPGADVVVGLIVKGETLPPTAFVVG